MILFKEKEDIKEKEREKKMDDTGTTWCEIDSHKWQLILMYLTDICKMTHVDCRKN